MYLVKREIIEMTFLKDFSICIEENEIDWIRQVGSGGMGGHFWQEMIVTYIRMAAVNLEK